jgi:hypothetical protein
VGSVEWSQRISNRPQIFTNTVMRGYSTRLDWRDGPDHGWWVELLKDGGRVAYMSLGEWKSLGATQQAIEDGGDDGEEHSPQSHVRTGAAFAAPEEGEMATETDVQRLIKELAETGADPSWVAEAVAIEQEEAEAARSKAAAASAAQPPRPRPQLRIVVADRE